MILHILITIIAALVSGYLYHAGGLARGPEDPWIPQFLRRSWIRDWLCPACSLIVLFTWWHPKVTFELVWQGIAAYVIMAGALSTYWDWLFGEDNFYAHGFGVGAAFFPFCWSGMHWWAILISAAASCVLMGWLCARTSKAAIEEVGRGFISAATRILT